MSNNLPDKLGHLAAMERAATPGPWDCASYVQPLMRGDGKRVKEIVGYGVPSPDGGKQVISIADIARCDRPAVVRAAVNQTGPMSMALKMALKRLAAALPVAGETEAE